MHDSTPDACPVNNLSGKIYSKKKNSFLYHWNSFYKLSSVSFLYFSFLDGDVLEVSVAPLGVVPEESPKKDKGHLQLHSSPEKANVLKP